MTALVKRGNNFCAFLLASMEDKAFPLGVLLILLHSEWCKRVKRKEFSPPGANSFLEEMTPIEKGGRNNIDRVASPYTFTLKCPYI